MNWSSPPPKPHIMSVTYNRSCDMSTTPPPPFSIASAMILKFDWFIPFGSIHYPIQSSFDLVVYIPLPRPYSEPSILKHNNNNTTPIINAMNNLPQSQSPTPTPIPTTTTATTHPCTAPNPKNEQRYPIVYNPIFSQPTLTLKPHQKPQQKTKNPISTPPPAAHTHNRLSLSDLTFSHTALKPFFVHIFHK